jgi:hypothetical protein
LERPDSSLESLALPTAPNAMSEEIFNIDSFKEIPVIPFEIEYVVEL